MTGTDLLFFKNFLVAQKGSILNKTHEFKTDQLSTGLPEGDDADIASHNLSMNVSLHLHERDRNVLLEIDRALGKIEGGTYGQCEACSQDIQIKRLKARPFAALCIDCMEEQEGPRQFPH